MYVSMLNSVHNCVTCIQYLFSLDCQIYVSLMCPILNISISSNGQSTYLAVVNIHVDMYIALRYLVVSLSSLFKQYLSSQLM